MSESKFETVSSLVDNYQQSDEVFDELLDDEKLSSTWSRYHLIGDVLRDEVPETIQIDLSAEIAQALSEDVTILAPANTVNVTQALKAKVIQFSKPFGQLAIAASAAGLMILGVQQNVAVNDTVLPAQIVQTNPLGGIAAPVSFNYQEPSAAAQKQAFVEQQRRFQALLSDHQQQVKLNSLLQEKQKQGEEDTVK